MDNKILEEFHTATDLNIYVLDKFFKTITAYTTPLAPKLKSNIIEQIKNSTNDLDIYLITNKSNLGIFRINDFYIIGWNANYTLGGKGNYIHKAPLLDYKQFLHLMRCLYFMYYKKWPDTISSEELKIGDNIPASNEREHKNVADYTGYLAEKEMLDAISKGNLALYNKRFANFVKKGNFGSFGQSKSRNQKDMAIAATTLYTRAAIQGGLSVNEAYSLSDHFIKGIEKDTDQKNYYEYSRAIGEIFVNRVNRNKRINLTSTVYRAQEYISANFMHINNIHEIAKHVDISTSYLQHIFKKETGQSLIEFINIEKINYVKHELIFSNKNIVEIANDLGYSSQSQLSTIFKKITGTTPLKYRQQYK